MSRFFHRTPQGKLALSRRSLLRGAIGGAAALVALPTLEAMLGSHGTALADGSPIPTRFVTWCFGNGVRLSRWVPQGIGAAYPLSEELMPLANVKKYLSVLSGFVNKSAMYSGHYEGMTVFSGRPLSGFSSVGGATVDQIAAATLAGKTVFPSIQMGVSKRVTAGSPQIEYLSHKSADQPLAPEYNPQAIWTKLFGSYSPQADPTAPLRVSVLDVVRADAQAMRAELGKADQLRLDAHLESVDHLQKQITAVPPACALPGQPAETNVDTSGIEPLSSVNAAMSELLTYAFTCDITRVASVMFSGPIGATIFAEAGMNMEHHSLTHSTDQESVHKGVVFTMQCLAYLLESLMAAPEATGNVLDNTALFCSTECDEGLTEEHKDQPMLVAGGGGGALKTGVHYRSGGENTSDVLLACLQTVVPEATEIGQGLGYSKTPCLAIKA